MGFRKRSASYHPLDKEENSLRSKDPLLKNPPPLFPFSCPGLIRELLGRFPIPYGNRPGFGFKLNPQVESAWIVGGRGRDVAPGTDADFINHRRVERFGV